ncbi:MAG: nitrophenyl compound nitroreductase subunit ArsF family protein [Microbacter sp.]
MKSIAVFTLFSLLFVGIACQSPSAKSVTFVQKPSNAKVAVYYFHFKQRCSTCWAVENNAKDAVMSLYPKQVKQGVVSFESVNLDDASSQSLAKSLGIEGQYMIVLADGKKVDLTGQGFLYDNHPEKMKAELQKVINPLL